MHHQIISSSSYLLHLSLLLHSCNLPNKMSCHLYVSLSPTHMYHWSHPSFIHHSTLSHLYNCHLVFLIFPTYHPSPLDPHIWYSPHSLISPFLTALHFPCTHSCNPYLPTIPILLPPLTSTHLEGSPWLLLLSLSSSLLVIPTYASTMWVAM